MNDPYSTLNIGKDATNEEIKKAYKNAAKCCHPDVNGNGDDTEFKRVKNAYEILTDPVKRKRYDMLSELIDDEELMDEIINRLHSILKQYILESIRMEYPIDLNGLVNSLDKKLKKSKEVISNAERHLKFLGKMSSKIQRKNKARFDPLKEASENIKQEIHNEISMQKIEIRINTAIMEILKRSYKIEKTQKKNNQGFEWGGIIESFL